MQNVHIHSECIYNGVKKDATGAFPFGIYVFINFELIFSYLFLKCGC